MTPSRSSRTCSSADLALVLLVAVTVACVPARPPATPPLLKRPFRIEAAPSYPGALFHWIDSLAGTSTGKTIKLHQQQYADLYGPLSVEDQAALDAFVAARADNLRRQESSAARGGPPVTFSALLGIFCSAATLDDALAHARGQISQPSYDGLAGALRHFAPKYARIWNDGAIPRAFLERARADQSIPRLGKLIARIRAFYDVDPRKSPPPRLALVPVPSGGGTHAEAIGPVLLLEIREEDTLADEASVIVHETSHFLWRLVPEERQQSLIAVARSLDETPPKVLPLLGEAVPTALGQGVADRMFRPRGWSLGNPWYHIPEIDLLAKRIYPLVQVTLQDGKTFDDRFVRQVYERK